MSGANPARVGAARALVAVEEGTHLDDVLVDVAPSEGVDRDLCWFLAFGVVRRRGEVDAALRPLLSRPLGGLDPEVRATLRVGAFEVLFARTRAHAAVHQAVEVARALKVGRASGLVNAVLRKVRLPADIARADGLNHPEWLVERWTERYGAAETDRWCAANNEPPPLFVVAADVEGGPPVPGAVEPVGLAWAVPGVWQVDRVGAAIPSLPGFAEGRWWVQDAAAVWMADLVPVELGDTVLDTCAAPGGKALRLWARGAKVTATDRDPLRLDRMRESLERVGAELELRRHDWGERGLEERFDAVLVDAPCTALGTVRRHPEIRWRRHPPDIQAAAVRQRRILHHAAGSVRVGGALVYSVCSPEPEEGPDVVRDFLADWPDFEQEEERSTYPPRIGEDAHYGARLRRKQ